MNLFGRLSALLLFILGIFQLSEYLICKGVQPLLWSKIAFISIAFLPILGVHLISLITKKTIWTKIGYIIAVILSLIIIFVPDIFISTSCTGNFVIFDSLGSYKLLHSAYYLLFLIIGISMIFFHMRDKNNKKNKALYWLAVAYAAFIVPATVVYIFITVTRTGVASILCGFAILTALIIVFKVLPEYKKLPNEKKE